MLVVGADIERARRARPVSTVKQLEIVHDRAARAQALGELRVLEVADEARDLGRRNRRIDRREVDADHAPTGDDKTSLCFGFAEDRAGILVETLQELARDNINMTKLESRPSKEVLGQYIFLVDVNGHRLDATLAAVLERVRAKTGLFKVFGSYPRYREK